MIPMVESKHRSVSKKNDYGSLRYMRKSRLELLCQSKSSVTSTKTTSNLH